MPEFELIYRTHYNKLRNTVENIIGDADASHDIVQEVFLKLWQKKNELDLILNIKAYLFKSVINSSITYLENKKRQAQLSDLPVSPHEATDAGLIQKELEAKIQIAVNKLPAKCKAIFVLSRYENLTYKEIAIYLNLSAKTVENQMGIAIKKMYEELKTYLYKEHTPL